MSIINNVLKDLELRSSQFTPIGVTSAGPVTTWQFRPSLLVTLIFLSMVFIGYLFWFYQVSQQHSDVTIDKGSNEVLIHEYPAIEVRAVSESLPKAAVQKPMNQLIGMQFRESNEAISLEFSLREKVVSYLKERSEKGLVFHLKDIESEIAAPVISDNRWIKQLTITSLSGGLDINLVTLAGVLVETGQQQVGSDIVWTITLSKLPDPIKVDSVVSSQSILPTNVDVATQTNEKIIKVDEDQALIEAKVVKLEIKSRDVDGDTVRQLKKAQALMKQRRYDSAEKLLLGLLDSTQDLEARESLMIVYKRGKKALHLNELVKTSMTRYPNYSTFKTRHAESLFRASAYQRVIDFLKNQTDLNGVQLALIGASYQRLDQHQSAADFYRQSLEVDISQSRNWIALGLSEEHNANLQQALSAYRSASKQGGLNAKLTEFVEQRSKILEKVIN